jgi:ZIP family zinc transporter
VDGYVLALLLSALPVAGNLLGGALAELVPLSARTLSLALHAAAGVVLAVVGLELMPEALAASAPWVPIVGFVAGGAAFLALDGVAHVVGARWGGHDSPNSAVGIYSAVSLDLFSDGVMIGTGVVVDPALGLLLAAGQTPADVPEGFAAVASARRAGARPAVRWAMTVAFALPILAGASLGYLLLRGAPEIVTLTVLAVTGGTLVSVVVEEVLPEAHEGETSRVGVLFLVGGFALFAALSAYA